MNHCSMFLFQLLPIMPSFNFPRKWYLGQYPVLSIDKTFKLFTSHYNRHTLLSHDFVLSITTHQFLCWSVCMHTIYRFICCLQGAYEELIEIFHWWKLALHFFYFIDVVCFSLPTLWVAYMAALALKVIVCVTPSKTLLFSRHEIKMFSFSHSSN